MFRRDMGEGVPAASVRAQGQALMMALSYVDAYYVQITEHCNNLGTSTTYALRPCLCTFESICVIMCNADTRQIMHGITYGDGYHAIIAMYDGK